MASFLITCWVEPTPCLVAVWGFGKASKGFGKASAEKVLPASIYHVYPLTQRCARAPAPAPCPPRPLVGDAGPAASIHSIPRLFADPPPLFPGHSTESYIWRALPTLAPPIVIPWVGRWLCAPVGFCNPSLSPVLRLILSHRGFRFVFYCVGSLSLFMMLCTHSHEMLPI